jgi:hypothetical protein
MMELVEDDGAAAEVSCALTALQWQERSGRGDAVASTGFRVGHCVALFSSCFGPRLVTVSECNTALWRPSVFAAVGRVWWSFREDLT